MTQAARAVSAVLLSYNHGHVLRDVVESVLDQTERAAEVIVSDDWSSDDTWPLLQEMARREPTLRAIRTPRNLGMAGNANFAVAQATSPFVALLHHDDLCRADLLESWRAVLERHPTAGFVFNAYGTVDGDRVYTHPYGECTPGIKFLDDLLSRWDCPVRGTALIRRDLWHAVGGMDERFGMLADVDLWMRLAARSDVGYCPEPLLSVGVTRPAAYPSAYTSFSWFRFKLLYDIHAANVPRRWTSGTARAACRWAWFRARVSTDAFKWIGYTWVRHPELAAMIGDGESSYEWALVRWARRLTRALCARRRRTRPRHA